MKRLMWAVCVLLLCVVGCSEKSSSNFPFASGALLHGTCAKGLPLPAGAIVDVRGTGIVPTSKASLSNDASEPAPPDILHTTVGADGTYTIDVATLTGPYLIRVHDTVGEGWSYCYFSVADSDTDVANINPITSMLIDAYYAWVLAKGDGSLGNYGTSNFLTGYEDDGVTPLPIPTLSDLAKIEHTFLNNGVLQLNLQYNLNMDITTLGSIFNSSWVYGSGYDTMLDIIAQDTTALDSTILVWSSLFPDYLDHYCVYFYNNDQGHCMYHSEIWTTGSVVISQFKIDAGLSDTTVPLIDSSGGVNHFSEEIDVDQYFQLTYSGLYPKGSVTITTEGAYSIDGVVPSTMMSGGMLHKYFFSMFYK